METNLTTCQINKSEECGDVFTNKELKMHFLNDPENIKSKPAEHIKQNMNISTGYLIFIKDKLDERPEQIQLDMIGEEQNTIAMLILNLILNILKQSS